MMTQQVAHNYMDSGISSNYMREIGHKQVLPLQVTVELKVMKKNTFYSFKLQKDL